MSIDPVSIIMGYIIGRPKKATLLVPKKISPPSAKAGGKDACLGQIVDAANDFVNSHRKKGGGVINWNPFETNTIGKITADGFKTIQVQFNPKSLDFRGMGGRNVTFTSGPAGQGENQLNTVDAKISTILSCELVFADVNSFNAFMDEAYMNLNEDSLKGAVKEIYTRARNHTHSVQPVVDGMLSLLVQNYTRQVIFVWDNTIFRGQLSRVDANYKMFNRWGDPIIATINIEIRQGDEEDFKYDKKYWREQFKKTFEEV